jgi:putative MATE family efflux protein
MRAAIRIGIPLRWRSTHRQAWGIAYPVIIGGLSQNVITLIDTYFLGHLGEVELGAGGLAGIWYFTLIVLAMGLGSGLQVMTARCDGEGNQKGIGLVVDAGLRIGLLLSVLIFIFHQALSPYLLSIFCQSQAVARASSEFLFWRSFDLPFTVIFFLLRGYLNGIQQNKILVWDAIATTAVNGGLCYLFIFELHMGIKGAALATVIAEVVAMGILVGYVIHKKIHHLHHFFLLRRVPKAVYHDLIRLSLPTAMQYFISMGSFFFFINIIEKMGERQLAASELVKNIYLLFMIPTWGFGTAAGAIVSNLLGQKKVKAVLPSLWGIMQISFAMSAVCSLILILFPTFIISRFTDTPALVAVTVPIMPVIFVSLLFYSMSAVMLNAVIGSGASKYALGVEVGMLTLYVSYLLIIKYGFEPSLLLYWCSEFIYTTAIGLGAYTFFKSNYWKNILDHPLTVERG